MDSWYISLYQVKSKGTLSADKQCRRDTMLWTLVGDNSS